MANFCIPKQFSEKLKKAATQKEFTMESLYEMTSSQRRKYFQKMSNPDMGKKINAEFEKAITSKQQDALENWVRSTMGITQQGRRNAKTAIDKIKELEAVGMLNPANMDDFLGDMVEAKLGVSLKPEEMQEILKLSSNLDDLAAKARPADFDITSATQREAMSEYLKQRNKLDKYVASTTPASIAKVFSGTISKGSMLLSPKSTLLNIESNIIQGGYDALARRVGNGRVGGDNGDLAKDIFKYIVKTYNDTGYDLSRMYTLGDEQLITGEKLIHAQGPGKVRAVGRFYEDVVFKNMLGKPDVVSSAAAFSDSLNLASARAARLEGLKGEAARSRAREIMKDAFKINPTSGIGQLIREQAIADAQFATYTNDTALSRASLQIRQALNNATGDARLGDQIMLFVKTPANVVSNGLDYAGLGALKGTYRVVKAYSEGGKAAISKEVIKRAAIDAARSGLGITSATIIASQIDPEDFVGAYDPARYRYDQLRNSNTNAVRIGNKWVSLDYFGPLATPLTAMLYAKKYGKDKSIFEKVVQYGRGVANQVGQVPGFEEMFDVYDFLTSGKDLDKTAKGLTQSSINAIRSRIVPGFVSDIAKATDDVERETRDGGVFAQLQASIPIWRKSLPPKYNSLQQRIQTEPALSIILFGARMKTDNRDALVKEFERLEKSGNLPSVTEQLRTSSRVKDLKADLDSDTFEEAVVYYTDELRNGLTDLIASTYYQDLNDEEKKDEINDLRRDALDAMVEKYGTSNKTTKKPYVPKR